MSIGFELALWTLLIAATVTDLAWGKIFNAITLPFLVGGVVCRLFIGGLASFGVGLFAILVAFAVFFPLYALKTWAAGDVKLLMAVAAWSEYYFVLKLGFISVLVGALVGGAILFKKRGMMNALVSIKEHLSRRAVNQSLRIPFAPAFLISFLLMKIAEMKGWQLTPF